MLDSRDSTSLKSIAVVMKIHLSSSSTSPLRHSAAYSINDLGVWGARPAGLFDGFSQLAEDWIVQLDVNAFVQKGTFDFPHTIVQVL
jgi:hypothetical protein